MGRIKPIILFFAFFAAPSQGAVVLKVKNSQALVHLEGMRAGKGSYFEVLDIYGERRGIVNVKRAGKKKAIVALKWGRIKKGWSLEPTSKKQALNQIKQDGEGKKSRQALLKKKRLKKKRRLARLEKQKLKRRARRKRMRKRRLARKRAAAHRRLASVEPYEDAYTEPEEYLINDNQLSGGGNPADNVPAPEDSLLPSSEEMREGGGGISFPFTVGVQPEGGFDLLKIKPRARAPVSSLSGLGYGGKIFFSAHVNDFLSVEPQIGYRKYSVSSKDCDERGGCFLSLDYVTAGADLKIYLTGNFWAGARGVLMYPLQYENKTDLKEESFEGLHGTLGGALGYDIAVGNLIAPVSLHASLFMPHSKTVSFYSVGLAFGLGFQF